MRRFATPTLPITLRYRNKTIAEDFEFDYFIFTIANENRIIEKNIPYDSEAKGVYYATFTQEETGSLCDGSVYEMQLNVMVGEQRIPTEIKRGKVQRNLHNEVIIV